MILARLTRAFRTQNWFAVALEFVIVIAGVVVGFQITAWNDAQGDIRRLELQAEAVRQEMLENMERLSDYEEHMDRSIDHLTEFSAYLAGTDDELAQEELAVLVFIAIRVEILQLKTTALEGLLAADNVVALEPACLLDIIEDWESSRQRLMRTSQDTLHYRDNVVYARFSEILPMDQVAATQSGFAVHAAASGASLADAINAHRSELASIIASRQIMSVTDRHLMRQLQQATENLIAALSDRSCEPTE
ncbi:hypothetical protein V0U79_06065 [Hyphobacterium sp. HN65]|uniref:Uncharacterized protein n=1 Tax=Hyphobacterium lacteum TaxID=3116575 RepID=A0ABU7LQQ3_9PROT|nr:hypothetical protein [Hyphobacterium sp. HN65]MEE2525924.1 hypothetical protein [Hyphobacterium sp. HN65]